MTTDHQEIVSRLKNVLKKYSPPFEVKNETEKSFELYLHKPVKYLHREYPQLFFAGTILQKNFVGFYFMPIYVHPELKKNIAPILLKTLKGKSCFHITELAPEIEAAIVDALEVGSQFYKKTFEVLAENS